MSNLLKILKSSRGTSVRISLGDDDLEEIIAALESNPFWVPISTPPTEKDANAHGQVFAIYKTSKFDATVEFWNGVTGKYYSHWAPIPPL